MKSIKRIPVFIMAVILCMCSLMPTAAFAASNDVGGGNAVFGDQDTSQTQTHANSGDGVYSDKYGYIASGEEALGAITGQADLPEVTTGDVQNWVDRKGGELISIIIRVVQVVSVVGFVVCIVLIVIGAVGNSRTMVGGVVGLVISCLCFTAATMAPQIIGAVNGWLLS